MGHAHIVHTIGLWLCDSNFWDIAINDHGGLVKLAFHVCGSYPCGSSKPAQEKSCSPQTCSHGKAPLLDRQGLIKHCSTCLIKAIGKKHCFRKKHINIRRHQLVGCVLRHIDEVIYRWHPHLLSLAKDVKLGFNTVPTGNRTPGHRVAVHYTTVSSLPKFNTQLDRHDNRTRFCRTRIWHPWWWYSYMNYAFKFDIIY